MSDRRIVALVIAVELILLMPIVWNVSEPMDLGSFTGNSVYMETFHFSPFFLWKFGLDLLSIGAQAQGLASVLHMLGLSLFRSFLISWKLEVIAALAATGILIIELSHAFGFRRGRLLAIGFLLNPAIVWCVFGYSEQEVIALMFFLAALLAAKKNKLFLAGLSVGMGAGIEYWPLAAAVVILLATLGTERWIRNFMKFSVGAAATLVLNFFPLLAGIQAGGELFKTVNPTSPVAGVTTGPLIPFSLWIVGYHQVAYRVWLPIFAVFIISTCLVSLIRIRKIWTSASPHGEAARWTVSLKAGGTILVFAVLLDPQSLAQFSVIAIAGIVLLIIATNGEPMLTLAPSLAVISYVSFVPFASSWTGVAGAWVNQIPLALPASFVIASWSIRFAVIATFSATIILLTKTPKTNRANSLSGLGLTLCGVLALGASVLSAQGPLWTNAHRSLDPPSTNGPWNSEYVDSSQTIRLSGGRLWAFFPGEQWGLSKDKAGTFARDALLTTPKTEYPPAKVVQDAPLGSNPNTSQGREANTCAVTAQVPNLNFVGVNSIWINLWGKGSFSKVGRLWRLRIGNTLVQPTGLYYPAEKTNGFFSFSVPLASINKALEFQGPCSKITPLIGIFPKSGIGNIDINGSNQQIAYHLDRNGAGFATVSSVKQTDILNERTSSTPPIEAIGLGFVWSRPSAWRPDLLTISLALAGEIFEMMVILMLASPGLASAVGRTVDQRYRTIRSREFQGSPKNC